MQLREIHIDGFGAFADTHLAGLGPGINVLYGPNEHGKTTLLEFIRRVLFGFKDKRHKNENPYPALAGGAYGGRLVCEGRRGERVIIARTQGAKGGAVSVTLGDELKEGPAALEDALGHASEELFRHIYAFTLDELQSLDSLHGEEIKSRIYGAGLGLGRVSLSQIEKELQEQIKHRLKRGGGVLNDTLNQLVAIQKRIETLQENFPRYESLLAERGALMEQREGLEQMGAHEQNLLRGLELRLELFPAWLEREEARRQLEALGTESAFPETAYDSYQKLKTELDTRQRQLEEEEDQARQFRRQAEATEVPAALLQQEAAVEWLRQHLAQVRDALRDQIRLNQESDQEEYQIGADLKRIGPDWDEARVSKMQLTEGELEEVEGFERSFSELRQKTGEAETKLKYHHEEKARALSHQTRIPDWLKGFVYVLGGFGVAGVAAGVALGEPLLAGAGLGVLGLGGFLYWKTRQQPAEFESEDLVEQRLEAELNRARQAQEARHAEWNRWLQLHGLGDLLPSTPQAVEKTWTRILDAQRRMRQRANLQGRIHMIQAIVSEATERVRVLGGGIPDFVCGSDLITDMSRICSAFDAARQKQERLRELTARLEEQETKLKRLREQVAADTEALTALYRAADASAEDEFLERHARFVKRREWEDRLHRAERSIQLRVGEGAPFAEILKSLRGVQPDALETERGRVAKRLEVLQQERSALDQQIGTLGGEIARLEMEDDLLAAQTEFEMKRQALNRQAREWAAAALAKALLERAKRQFETTRQPAVIQTAATLFSQMTGGRYGRVIKPLEDDDLKIEDTGGRLKGLLEMSRGTREQLYLAMRFGLIAEYESRAEPLPVVMDDVFVNFDDERKPRVLELLQSFAAGRQVLLLTCHRQSLELCQAYGGRVVEW